MSPAKCCVWMAELRSKLGAHESRSPGPPLSGRAYPIKQN